MILKLLLTTLSLSHCLFGINFVLFTEPKSGTHLLIPILSELAGKGVYWAQDFIDMSPMALKEGIESVNGYRFSLSYAPWSRETLDAVWSKNQDLKTFLHLHAPYSSAMEAYLKERSTVNFFIKRDPRDLVVSLLNHYKNIEFNNKVVESLPNDDERLLYMIRNFSRRQTLAFMGWIQSPQCCVLDFRKLMGAHGGAATDEDAMSEMRKIASALHMKLSDNKLRTIYRKHFGKGWNFFRGKVGAWKDYFKDEHINAAKEEIGDLLIELGYEKNVDW